MFGVTGTRTTYKDNETEVEKLQRELKEANEEIARLKRALGPNHPDGYKSSLF